MFNVRYNGTLLLDQGALWPFGVRVCLTDQYDTNLPFLAPAEPGDMTGSFSVGCRMNAVTSEQPRRTIRKKVVTDMLETCGTSGTLCFQMSVHSTGMENVVGSAVLVGGGDGVTRQ